MESSLSSRHACCVQSQLQIWMRSCAGVFQISKTGQAIVDIMHRGLEQACSSGSPAVAASMLHALRDVAALYAALPPAVQKRELQVCL